jgi:hypothetical protein
MILQWLTHAEDGAVWAYLQVAIRAFLDVVLQQLARLPHAFHRCYAVLQTVCVCVHLDRSRDMSSHVALQFTPAAAVDVLDAR